ncbi:MAG: Uma2 family endonuclease [Cytophagales bacterium]|jgi:hypothetical protein|nr:Uma2 family endonuclease [Cytophagales bacterium]
MAFPATSRIKPKQKIPEYFVKEEMDGVPYYYKGFRKVLARENTLDEIMGRSVLQAVILDVIKRFLYGRLSNEYIIASNEAGLHLKLNDNVANDIAIYQKDDVKDLFSKKYFDVPPKFVIEVDIDVEAEVEKSQELQYVLKKTEKMLHFGVPKVVWVFSEDRKIMLAEPNRDWIITSWNTDIGLMDDIVLNLESLLKENGIL